MKKAIAILILSLSTSTLLMAQYGGFAGKRVALKTTLFDGKYTPLRNIEAEVALGRRFSISLGYQFFGSNKVGQRLDGDRPVYVSSNFSSDFVQQPLPSSFEKKAYVQTSNIYYMLKVYSNKVLPAPRGFFFYWQNGFGKGTFSGNNYDPYIGVSPFIESGVPVMNYGFGLGSQGIINKRITIEFLLGFSGTVVKSNGKNSQINTNLITPHWGSNLFTFNSMASLKPPLSGSGYFIYEGIGSYEQLRPRSSSFGMDFKVKVGFLLF